MIRVEDRLTKILEELSVDVMSEIVKKRGVEMGVNQFYWFSCKTADY